MRMPCQDCSDVSELEGSVDELNDVELDRGAISTVRADLEEVRTEANAVVDSAKQDFPSETRALKSSVASLSSAIDQLPPAPTAQQVVALAAEVDGAVRSAQDLARATESACD